MNPPITANSGNPPFSREKTFRPEQSAGVKSVLVVETERLSTMRKVISKTAAIEAGRNLSITVLCNEKRKKIYLSGSLVNNTLTYPASGIASKIRAAVSLLFQTPKFDMAVAVFNGQRHFARPKLLFWVLRARKRLAFDGKLDSFFLNFRTIGKLFSQSRKQPYRPGRVNVLIFETDGIEILREVIRITRADHVIPKAKVTVFCRDSSAELLGSHPQVNSIVSYRDHSFSSWFKTAFRTIITRQEVIVGVLNGRKRFFLSKLLFCLCRNRHRLVFNGSLDCCFWNRHTYGQIILQGLKSGVNSPFADNPRKVLILETAGPETMKRLIRIAAEPKVNPNARITLFCNEDRRETFSSMPEIEHLVTYSDSSLRNKLEDSLKIIFTYPDAVVARFNGDSRRDFKPLKTLFWLVRTPSRIVFNETLDCYYINRKNAHLLFSGRRGYLSERFLSAVLRQVVKGLLFFPRFIYLLVWRGINRLKFRLF